MNIAIGALVLCKVLISEPSSSKLNAPSTPAPSESTSSRESVGSTSRVYGENPLQKLSQKPRIKEGGIVYTMIEGEVVDLTKESYYAPVKGTNKYEMLEEEFLVIKSKEIDHLVISGRACGLKSAFMYDEKVHKEDLAKKAKAPSKKRAQNKEEVVIIRGGTIPEGYEAVELDKETEAALKKEYDQSIQGEEKAASEKFLKNLEHDQERFSRKQTSNQAPAGTSLSDTEAQEQIKEIEQVETAKQEAPVESAKPEKPASELFDQWEAERKAELEAQRKADQEAKKKDAKRQEKVAKKVEESKPVAPAPKVQNKAKGNEKSIIKDAFEIITTE